MNSLLLSKKLQNFLSERGFRNNGNDYYYKNFAITDLENNWEEVVYVSHKKDYFEVWYPSAGLKDVKFKTEEELMKYIDDEHGEHL